MEGQPLLGIAFPTYNRAKLLERSLASLRAELASVSETVAVLVCDNASSDDTAEVVRHARREMPALKSLRHAANVGGVANILRCIESTEAEWVWVLPDDCLLRPGILAELLQRLKTARSPVVYARCAQWDEDALDRVGTISADSLWSNHGHVWHHLSWLPCLLLHRASITRHLPQAYRLGAHSYPHLALALLALCENRAGASVSVVARAFSVQPGSGETKRYSWIHGAIWRFAQTIHACLPAVVARRILRRTARSEKLGGQVLACMPAEFSILPPGTPWSLVALYGFRLLPALMVFLWLRYCPRLINRALVKAACACTARGPFVRFHARCHSLASRLVGNSGYDADF